MAVEKVILGEAPEVEKVVLGEEPLKRVDSFMLGAAPETEFEPISEYGQRIGGALARGFMGIGQAALRLPAVTVRQAGFLRQASMANRVLDAKTEEERKHWQKKMYDSQQMFEGIARQLEAGADLHKVGQEVIERNHPEWRYEPPEGFVDLVTSPSKLGVALAESTPLLFSAGVLTVAGQPNLAVGLMYATEGQQAYDQAKMDGATEDEAAVAYGLYGSVAAVLENMQLQGILKIGKGSYNTVLNRTVQKVASEGRKGLTRQILETAAKEAAEEVSQGSWQEITAKAVYDQSIPGGVMGFIDRRAQEAYIGGMLGLIPGVAGGVAARTQRAIGVTPAVEKLSLDEMRNIRKQRPASDMEAKLYDILIKKAEAGDEAAIDRLNNLVQGLQRPTYEELLERANLGDARAVEAIQQGFYRAETPGGIAGTSMPLLPKRETTEVVKRPPKEIPVEQTEITEEALNLTPLPKKPSPPRGEARERGFVTSVKEEFPELEERVAGQYVPRSTDNLAVKARNLVLDDIDAAETLARKANNDEAVATVSELIKHYVEKAETSDITARNTFLDKAADIAHDAAAKLTELGRAVQAASILSSLTPEGQLRFAARTINKYNERARKKIPQLTPKQSQDILKRAKRIKNMPDGQAKSEEFWKLQNHIAELVPTSLYRKFINIWKAGLLTGLKTHGLNIGANLAHGVSETVKDVPAAAIDKVVSLFTKKRKLAFTAAGLTGGVKEGFLKGWKYLNTGYSERDVLTKLDYRKVNWGKSRFGRIMQAYEQTVFRLLGAADQPFYYGAKARSIQSQAIAQAKNKGLKGQEAKNFIDNLVENPTDEMIKYAVIDAETAVFQNRTALGDLARAIQRAGGEVIVPFGRTPSAVAMQIINYSPLGIVKTIGQQIKEGKFDQRLFSQAMGRAITGTAAIYLGTILFNAGRLSLDRPRSERERKLWELEGRQANSVKVNGKWRQIPVFGPVGNLLLIGGHFQSMLDETGSPSEAIVSALAGGAKSFSEQTFVTGINRAAEAVTDPERSFETFFSSLAGSVVPTMIADFARVMDSTERRTKGPIQRIITRVPILREKLEPRINVFGQDLPRYGGNVLEVMIDPTRPAKIRNDIVIDELRRLWDLEIKVSPTLLGDKYGYEALTPEQNTFLWQQTGKMLYPSLYNLIRSREYKTADDEQKGKDVERLTQLVKNTARASIVSSLTKNLKGDEKITKLRELKETGLLTNDVLKIYVEID